MKIFGLFHVAVSRQDPDMQRSEEWMKGFREGRKCETETRQERTRDMSFVEGMLAGVDICAEAGHTAQPSGTEPGTGYDWSAYAEGLRDGAAVGHDRDTLTTRTTAPHRPRRDHSHLRLVTS